jgi:hypothetical protein
MKKLHEFLGGFIDEKDHKFKHKIGKYIASSLSGFIAGIVCASVFWLVAIIFLIKK